MNHNFDYLNLRGGADKKRPASGFFPPSFPTANPLFASGSFCFKPEPAILRVSWWLGSFLRIILRKPLFAGENLYCLSIDSRSAHKNRYHKLQLL